MLNGGSTLGAFDRRPLVELGFVDRLLAEHEHEHGDDRQPEHDPEHDPED